MAVSPHLKTSSLEGVRDASLSSSGGVVESGAAPTGFHSDAIAQAPHIPSEKPHTEISEVVGDGESCGAVTASLGGDEGPGHVNEVATKCASVKTHGVLMRAHQMGSVTKDDHAAIHGPVTANLGKPGPTRSR